MFVEHPLIRKGTVKLRSYQERAVSAAIGNNTLVVLPTGLGKTVIALMVAAHRMKEFPEKKVLFLAPTKPLVEQHKKTFDDLVLDKKTCVLTGLIPAEKRKKLWEESRIIFATPQTVESDMARGLRLTDFSLVIFDEAHRAVGDYSYVDIASHYMKNEKGPMILGLTASPSSSREKVDEIRKNLFITRVEAKTESDADVRPYVKETRIEWVKVELPDEFKSLKSMIEEVLRDRVRSLKSLGYLESAELRRINKRVLLAVQSKIRTEISEGSDSYGQASTIASVIKVYHALELLETQGVSSLNEYFKRMAKQRSRAVKNLLLDERMRKIIRTVHDLTVLGTDHPKLDELSRIVAQNSGKRILVFTHYRDSVDKIIERLTGEGVSAHEFIGQAQKGLKKGMTQKKQVQILDDFREGRYSVLVATSVAEEGLDIPRVDMVIFYEPVPSEIRSIQRRGRTGRTEAGKVIILMAKNTRDEGYFWASYHKERRMREIIDEIGNKDYGQQSLLMFTDESAEEVRILADVRESKSLVVRNLKEKAKLELRQLAVADFILSDRVGVERKTVDDFLQSIVDKRLFEQAVELSNNFEVPILILEGQKDIFAQRDIHPNAIRGALVSLPLDLGVSILPTKNESETAEILFSIAKREQFDEDRPVALRGERKPLTLEERQRFVVESLPFVSSVLAKRLLEKFGSVQNVFNAQEKELMEVEGIGKKKAEEIRNVVKSRYGK